MATASGATSFKIRGIEPPELARYPDDIRKLYWGWVVEIGLRVKGKEILAGIDKHGNYMSPTRLNKRYRKHRKSDMTPSGRGDPNAPVLIPGHQKSRTYSLLAGRAFSTHAEFYWRYDAWTGRQWGEILSFLAQRGYDTIGLSPDGLAAVKVGAYDRWTKWIAGTLKEKKLRPQFGGKIEVPKVGKTNTTYTTRGATLGGQTSGQAEVSGFMTSDEWARYLRGQAPAVPPGRPRNPRSRSPISGPSYNRLISYTWPQGPPSGPPKIGGFSVTGGGPRTSPKRPVAKVAVALWRALRAGLRA